MERQRTSDILCTQFRREHDGAPGRADERRGRRWRYDGRCVCPLMTSHGRRAFLERRTGQASCVEVVMGSAYRMGGM
jgi:hypothetical protein